LSLREVVRDEDGSLNELKDWTWWGLELIRRVIRDWWIDGQRGNGAEGVVLLIDVGGAGYRNMVSFPYRTTVFWSFGLPSRVGLWVT